MPRTEVPPPCTVLQSARWAHKMGLTDGKQALAAKQDVTGMKVFRSRRLRPALLYPPEQHGERALGLTVQLCRHVGTCGGVPEAFLLSRWRVAWP